MDIDEYFELDADPDVHLYLTSQPVQNKQQIADSIQFIRQQYIDNGIGRWAVIDKRTNAFMGWAELKLIAELTNNHINFLDLGYRLIKKYWGQGFATEAAQASLTYAFDVLQAPEVFAHAHAENIGSNKVLSKAGLTLTGSFVHHGIKCNWYRIDRKDFQR